VDAGVSHNDLGIEHVLVDPDTGMVTGVIDWSDAAIVDPAIDVGLLYRDLGPAAARAALGSYRTEVNDLATLEERAVFYARCRVFEDLAYGLQMGRRSYVDKSLATMAWAVPGVGVTIAIGQHRRTQHQPPNGSVGIFAGVAWSRIGSGSGAGVGSGAYREQLPLTRHAPQRVGASVLHQPRLDQLAVADVLHEHAPVLKGSPLVFGVGVIDRDRMVIVGHDVMEVGAEGATGELRRLGEEAKDRVHAAVVTRKLVAAWVMPDGVWIRQLPQGVDVALAKASKARRTSSSLGWAMVRTAGRPRRAARSRAQHPHALPAGDGGPPLGQPGLADSRLPPITATSGVPSARGDLVGHAGPIMPRPVLRRVGRGSEDPG
jgi:hypothetical protein